MAQSGVLKGLRVQLTDELTRTKYEADLSANDSGTLPQVSSYGGSGPPVLN
jgi:hypothetical protein